MYYLRVIPGSVSTRYRVVLAEIMVVDKLLQGEWIDERTRKALKKHRKFLQYRRPWVALRERLWRQAARELWRSPGAILFIIRKLPEKLRRFFATSMIRTSRKERR